MIHPNWSYTECMSDCEILNLFGAQVLILVIKVFDYEIQWLKIHMKFCSRQ